MHDALCVELFVMYGDLPLIKFNERALRLHTEPLASKLRMLVVITSQTLATHQSWERKLSTPTLLYHNFHNTCAPRNPAHATRRRTELCSNLPRLHAHEQKKNTSDDYRVSCNFWGWNVGSLFGWNAGLKRVSYIRSRSKMGTSSKLWKPK